MDAAKLTRCFRFVKTTVLIRRLEVPYSLISEGICKLARAESFRKTLDLGTHSDALSGILSFMNRLQRIDAPMNPSHLEQRVEIATRRLPKRQRSSHHRFFVPLHYEKNYGYPLLVWLHGPTGTEFEINQVMPHISMRNYVGVAPRGPVKHHLTQPNGDPTYTWDQQERNTERALEDVMHCIAEAKRRFHIAKDRVFLVGNGVGGTMALRIGLSSPQDFAGVASIGGGLPNSRSPLSEIQYARTLPILIAQCRDSAVYSTDAACTDLRLLHAAGIAVALRQYPCDQEVTTKMLSDLNAWAMEKVSGVPAEVPICDDPTALRIRDCN